MYTVNDPEHPEVIYYVLNFVFKVKPFKLQIEVTVNRLFTQCIYFKEEVASNPNEVVICGL